MAPLRRSISAASARDSREAIIVAVLNSSRAASDEGSSVCASAKPALTVAPLSSWLLTLAASAGLMLLVALLIRLTPKPAPLPMRRKPAETPKAGDEPRPSHAI